jgi:hypothetical protein
MSYDHGCNLTSQFRLDPEDYVSPLVMPPPSRLIVPAGCCIASCHPLIATPSRRLVAPAGLSHCLLPFFCCVTLSSSRRASLLSHQLSPSSCCATLSSSRRAGWLLHRLLMHHPFFISSSSSCPLIVSSSCRAPLLSSCHARRQLVVPLVLSSCRLVVALPLLAPPSHPLVMPAILASPSPCRSLSLTPSNSVECCLCHQTPLPPPLLNAVSIVH